MAQLVNGTIRLDGDAAHIRVYKCRKEPRFVRKEELWPVWMSTSVGPAFITAAAVETSGWRPWIHRHLPRDINRVHPVCFEVTPGG